MTTVDDPRARSAHTKKLRTRHALLEAGRPRFAELGWDGTRMEDVARDAGVGAATAYSHFTKQTLIGHIYAPLLQPLLEHTAADIELGLDPGVCLRRHVHDLSRTARRHRNLTIALITAVQEHTLGIGSEPRPGDLDDVRVIVPVPKPMIDLIRYGQRAGHFADSPRAAEVGSYHTNALMLRVVTRPTESAPATARMVLSQLLPPLLVGFREEQVGRVPAGV